MMVLDYCRPPFFDACGYDDLRVEVFLGQSETLAYCQAFINAGQ